MQQSTGEGIKLVLDNDEFVAVAPANSDTAGQVCIHNRTCRHFDLKEDREGELSYMQWFCGHAKVPVFELEREHKRCPLDKWYVTQEQMDGKVVDCIETIVVGPGNDRR